ncbi:hypothetical protein ACX6XY_04415 [Streptomyces sp. O3]
MEFPEGYDHAEAKRRAGVLVARLNEEFNTSCHFDNSIQDASFHALLAVPGVSTEAGTQISVRLSCYARLAVVMAKHPGAYTGLDDAVTQGALTERDRARVETALHALGYVIVPEELLHRPYDGVTNLNSYQESATWWTRFFNYI